ncbi:MAG: hypothetical protein KF788_02465 [Piscinibacter sp.]|nr:hypothetical protein [Piscinibacter sp.]
MTRSLLLLGLMLATSSQALAAPIYRCGPGGKTYSQAPCADGTVIEATDPRSAAQRAEARRMLAAERRRAAELERERLAAEKAAEKNAAGAVSVSATPADDGKPAGKTAKGGKSAAKEAEGTKPFTAVVPKAAATAAR